MPQPVIWLWLVVAGAEPSGNPSPAGLTATFEKAAWLDEVRAHGYDPLRPASRAATSFQVSFAAKTLSWGDESLGVSGSIETVRLEAGSWLLAVRTGPHDVVPVRWRWLASDRAVFSDGATTVEVVRLRPGESLEAYQQSFAERYRRRWLPRLAGTWGRGALDLAPDGRVRWDGGVRAGSLTPCLTACAPDAGVGVCLETELKELDPMKRARLVFAFTPASDGGMLAWRTDDLELGYCREAPATSLVGGPLTRP